MKNAALTVLFVAAPGPALALVVSTTPGTWDLFEANTKLGSHATESACVQAALARGIVQRYTCRTSTIVDVSGSPPTPSPAVQIRADPASVAAGVASTLSWSATNASGCTASGAWSGSRPTSGSESTGPLSTQRTYTLTCNGSGGSASSSVVVSIAPASGAMSGLEWSGNESTNYRRMLYWANPFAMYPATYVFKVLPKGPKKGPNATYWTTFFWGNNGNFAWDNYSGNSYYGAHPYPTSPPAGANQAWEIAVYGNDYLGSVPQWNRWHTQVFRAWRESASVTQHEFIYDYDSWLASGGAQGVIRRTINDPGWAKTAPPKPAIVVGQAPALEPGWQQQSWGGFTGYEEFKGVIRGLQFYDARLTDAQLAAELASPGSARSPWYLNVNPTPADVKDRSGNGHDPAWQGSSRPSLWTN